MGYDMHWVKKDPEEETEYRLAHEAFRTACEVRDALPNEERGRHTLEEFQADDFEPGTAPANATDRYRAAQAAVMEASAAMYASERSYFRLNIWGMGHARQIMSLCGMLADCRHPELDEWPDEPEMPEGTVEDPDGVIAEPGKFDAELISRCTAYVAQRDAMLSLHEPADAIGIPSHKLGSNDGWLVTPDECQAALLAWTEWRAQHREVTGFPDWWDGWLGWIQGAIEHDGFRVY